MDSVRVGGVHEVGSARPRSNRVEFKKFGQNDAVGIRTKAVALDISQILARRRPALSGAPCLGRVKIVAAEVTRLKNALFPTR